MDYYEKLLRCTRAVQEKINGFTPRMGIILGSGLGGLADEVDIQYTVPYRDIEGFPVSTAPGHAGQYLFGTLQGVPVVCMQGRIHFYEGFDITDVVLPTRVMAMLGAKKLLLTNAAGCTDPAAPIPSLMVIRDHNMLFFGHNPLVGVNHTELGVRFPDMTTLYDPAMSRVLLDTGKALNLPMTEGVYAQLTGPSYETPAEVRMLGQLGCRAVGMSTACEAVAAHHMGVRVCGVSMLANAGAGITGAALTEEEVLEAGVTIGRDFTALVRAAVPALDRA